MEMLANNGHSTADEAGSVGLSDICKSQDGLFRISPVAFGADNIVYPSGLGLEDGGIKVNTKKRAFDEESKELQSPSKKLAVRSSSDAEAAEEDSALLSSPPLIESMIIDTTWGKTGHGESVNQAISGSMMDTSGTGTSSTIISSPSPEAGNRVSTGAPSIREEARESPNSQRVDVPLLSVDSNVNTTEREGDLIASESGQVEAKVVDNGLNDSLGLMTEECLGIPKDTPMLQNVSENCDVSLEADEQVISNVSGEERVNAVMVTEKCVADAVVDDRLLCSRPSGVGSVTTEGEFHAAGASPASTGEASACEAQPTPLLLGSHTAEASEAIEKSGVANGAAGCETGEEEGVDDESGISEVDELQMEKVDAAKALEMKMVEVIMLSPAFELAESRIDGMRNSSSDDPSSARDEEGRNRGKDSMNGFSGDDKFTDLFGPVVELPAHSEGTNGLVGGAAGAEDVSNGQVSDNLHFEEEGLANNPILVSQRPHDPRSVHVGGNKDVDFTQHSGSDKGDDSMDRQDSDVATPSGATSAQSQSSDLKLRLKMKGAGDMAPRESVSMGAGRGYPVKEVLLKEAPASAKLLLSSGLLNGHRVRYIGRGGQVMLTGVIQEGGVLCDCSACKGVQVVNVSAFEKHAGSSARHPSDFIFLENGKCLKDILEIGWNANKQKKNAMDALKFAIGEVGGENIKIRSQDHVLIQNQAFEKKPRLYTDTRPRLPVDTKPKSPLDVRPRMPVDIKPRSPLDNKLRSPLDVKPRSPLDNKPLSPLDAKAKSTIESKARGSEARATPARDRSTREKETVSSPGLSRETSGANLHKALFLPGGLEDDTEVGYYVKGQKVLSGLKRGAGILCSCCQQVISCSLFEQHAGWGSRRNPYTSIYLSDGRCLHEAAQSLVVEQVAKQEGLSPRKIEHLDQCVECGDAGDLQLCAGCPNAYHQDCLGSGEYSTSEFFCPDCQEQRFGGTKDRRRSMVKRRSKGASKTLLSKDHVTGRCTRLLQVLPEATVLGGCVFCKSGEFAKSGFGPMTTMLCDQCEREYHVGCLKEHGLEDLKELPEVEWFCGQDCKYIHTILNLLVLNGPEPLADSKISKALKCQPRFDASEDAESTIGSFEWQLLHGRGGDSANGKTLAEAVQIFSECFDPIADGRSGGDLIPLMVYRRSIRDQDFRGIYCVVLKQYNKVVSTALIRVFGRQLAELPLLATIPSHQGQGHCKALLLSIERLLGVLRVERLALPAAEGAEGIWLNKFGFSRMSVDQMKQFHTDYNMMIFTGSSMLEKEIAPLEISGSRS